LLVVPAITLTCEPAIPKQNETPLMAIYIKREQCFLKSIYLKKLGNMIEIVSSRYTVNQLLFLEFK
jgi:hypothetical protein